MTAASAPPRPMARERRAFWIAAAIFLVLDLVSKYWLFARLGGPPAPEPGGPYGEPFWIVPGLFRLHLFVNDGAAFGLGSGATMLLAAVAALLGPILTLLAYSCKSPGAPLWALGMVVGGAVGNLYDRLWFSGVRDFFELTHPVTLRPVWAIFNVADVGITVGVAIYLVWSFVFEPRQTGGATPESPTP